VFSPSSLTDLVSQPDMTAAISSATNRSKRVVSCGARWIQACNFYFRGRGHRRGIMLHRRLANDPKIQPSDHSGSCRGLVNRSVAIPGDPLFMATGDAHLVAG
jgi:hypothetical protein